MNKKILFPILVLPLLLSSCVLDLSGQYSESDSGTGSESESTTETESETESEVTSESESESETTPGSESEEQEPDLYDLFYDHKNKVDIKLDFKNNAIYKLAQYSADENKKDMYHPVDVTITINGTEHFFEECGARMKGNTSRNPNFVNSNGEISALVHFKISFNQTFDDAEDNDYYIRTWESKDLRTERKNRRFGGAKKFDIKYNKNNDFTYAKQMYAYDAFREVGVFAERDNLVKVTLKTQSDSETAIYLAQECIDKEFLQRRLPKSEAKGNLYKSTYTSMGPASLTSDTINAMGVEGPNYHPSYDLKTNDDPEEIDHTLLKNLITTINDNKSDAATFKPVIDNLIDVDNILKYLAMCWVMGNPDDTRNNYNNYYIYFNSSTNKAIFIPYDFDRCLGIMKDWEIHMESTPYHSTKAAGKNREWQKNPLLWRLILKTKSGETSSEGLSLAANYRYIEEYRNKYIAYCTEYANKYLDKNYFQQYVNGVYYANKNINSETDGNISFQEYASAKLATFTNSPDN